MFNQIKIAAGLAGLICGGLLAGCSSGEAGSASSTTGATAPTKAGEKKSLKITMIAKSSTNPVFLAAKEGAEAAAAELTKEKGVTVTIDWRTPPNEDGQVQAQNIAAAVNEKADAILLSCSDAGKVTGAINDAVDKGVPVMTFDSDAPDSKRFAFYGADDVACGAQVMSELAKLTDGKANVAILAGNQNAPNLQKRVQGVKDEAKKYAGVKIVGVFNHIETPNDAAAAVVQAMNANPEINAWAMVGGWPLFTRTLLNDLKPDKVKVVAVDALPAQLDYVDTGIAPVLLAQPVYDWGHVSVQKIYEKVIEGKNVDSINKMDLIAVRKDNLMEWAGKLQEWKMPGIDPKYLKK